MTWLDQLQPASFRNVPFHVDSIDVSAGDNTVLREYPFQDLPTVFRMGEAAEEIKISAYVVGPDYMERREALRAVLTGQGDLVHPTAGTITVFVVGKFSIKEAPTAEGGMARFDLTFVRARARCYPVGVVSTPATAAAQAEVTMGAAVDTFANMFDLARKPGWIAEMVMGRINGAVAEVWGVVAGAAAGLGAFNSEIVANYQVLRNGLNGLVRQPRLLADAVRTLFALPADLSRAASRDYVAAFEGLWTVGARLDGVVPGGTVVTATTVATVAPTADGTVLRVLPPSRNYSSGIAVPGPFFAGLGRVGDPLGVSDPLPPLGVKDMVSCGLARGGLTGQDTVAVGQLVQLTAAVDQLVEVLATAAWVQAVAAMDLKNYDDVVRMRGALQAQCTRLLRQGSGLVAPGLGVDPSGMVPWHSAVSALLSAGLGDLAARSADMARLQTYTPEAWTPVWQVSYRLFGTAAYADEILAMNPHVEHPMLVPAGKALRVVNHG